jgi:hypothetical protein
LVAIAPGYQTDLSEERFVGDERGRLSLVLLTDRLGPLSCVELHKHREGADIRAAGLTVPPGAVNVILVRSV